MSNTIQDQVKSEWKTVQDKGGERASRIREIVKEAATGVVAELKDGTADLQQLSRKSLAEMIAQLKAKEAAEAANNADIAENTDTVALVEVAPEETEPTVPTWRQIIQDLGSLINARKGVWTHQVLVRLEQQMAKFDAEMTAEHGDRYATASRIINRLRAIVRWAAARAAGKAEVETTEATPVAIEVVDADPTPAAAADTAG